MADLNETSLEDALIDISTFTDDKGLTISVQATKLVVPPQLNFVAERILNSTLRPATSDNDINAVRSTGETTMEPDFSTGNIRYKARERYSFGFSDWRGIYGSQGA